MKANRRAGTTLAFFTANDLNFSEENFEGAYFDEKGRKWQKKSFPFPDVVYIRGGGGETDGILERFDELGIKRINPIHAFNKSELYQYLNENENLRSYLPSTVNVDNRNEIKNTILKFRKAYVKAHRGRKGLQVMRIEKLPKNPGYVYSYSIIGKLVRRKANNMQSLLKNINTFFGNKKVIVQRAIDLVKINKNRLVDFRAEVQRNKNGEIDIVGICVRVGSPNSPITTHSFAYRYDVFLPKLFPRYTAKQLFVLKIKIKKFLHQVYLGVENKYGKFGEIGIDFAVDRRGKIWLIECNAQSAKVSIVKAYGSRAERVFLNPLEYAKTITNFDRDLSSFETEVPAAIETVKGTEVVKVAEAIIPKEVFIAAVAEKVEGAEVEVEAVAEVVAEAVAVEAKD
ncbi:YheC/YheD family endospore coat-associated protein [Cohnella mopanensis]|uniref:YheC/YheD family endospore coat-associated protein n=1 Tax=Cohnella mopanensis TaxID=2911966 RepID=UPI001EF8F9E7